MLYRFSLKKIACLAIFIGSFALNGLVSAQDTTKALTASDSKIRNIDGVVAVVNTGYITRKDIDDRITLLKKQGVKLPEDGSLRKAILERLIIEKIQLQNAEQEGMALITNKELDKIIADIAEKNKISVAEFKNKIVASGSTFDRYKQLLRDDIVLSRYKERAIESRIKVSDAEIDNFIAERNRAISSGATSRSVPAAKGEPEEIDVAQIFISLDPASSSATKIEAKKKADQLLREARANADFMQLGATASKDNPNIKLQDLGYRTPDRLPQLFYEAVKNVGGGQVVNVVIKSPAGFHILKVLDRRAISANNASAKSTASTEQNFDAPQNIMVTQTMARHILLRSRAGLTDQDAERRLAGYRDQVKIKTADFGELAKKYSEDGSAPNGGNLGWMGPGDLVPEFELAMNRLQIGEVSNPVKTEFGWHLIQVLERREVQLTLEKQRQFARAAIRERKIEQAYQDWIRELRDTATVKILNGDDGASNVSR
ncbi:peptidylprolyl isomerase [Polynucleobacter tropicus]|uniref:Chaperone SurA n=1 Tax=Polynucleobacter tropicus TaxID=1743174 RepID=A0A6M9Q7W6_9BURK|nr:peptidylprolyl isomerase [Polynucleobacter tropicus]